MTVVVQRTSGRHAVACGDVIKGRLILRGQPCTAGTDRFLAGLGRAAPGPRPHTLVYPRASWDGHRRHLRFVELSPSDGTPVARALGEVAAEGFD